MVETALVARSNLFERIVYDRHTKVELKKAVCGFGSRAVVFILDEYGDRSAAVAPLITFLGHA